jgi:hypothetical protein
MPELTEFQKQLAEALRGAATRQIALLSARGEISLANLKDDVDKKNREIADLDDFMRLLDDARLPDESEQGNT